jgi:glycosyltransferase involved in cell wall biosynthesis
MHYTAPPVVGGVEAVIQAHLEVLTAHSHPVRVIAGRGDDQDFPPGVELQVIPEIDSQHPTVVSISAQLEQGEIPDEFYALRDRLVEKIAPWVADLDHLIVHNLFTKHFNLPLTAALCHLLEQQLIADCIAWCHDFTWTSPNSRHKVHPGYPWDLLRYKQPDTRYVVISKQRQVTLAELFICAPAELQVIYNGVDPKVLLGLSAEGLALIDRLGLFESDLVLLMPVRVTQAKNIEFALQVVAALKRLGSKPKLLLSGPPDPHDPDNLTYYEALKALRVELGVEEELRFVYESGPQNGEGFTIGLSAVGDLLRVSDLVFMPSHREGFGMPVLEAGLAGIPVMTTEIPATLEIGGDDVLVIQLSQSPAEVAQMILDQVATRPEQRLRRRVRQSYTWEAIYQQAIRPLLLGGENPS